MGTSVEAQPGLAPLRRASESTLVDSLGEVEFRKAHTQGNTMESSAAIAYAMEESPAPPGPVDKSRQTGPPGLTKREGEIAQLVMAGLSNKEIASKLVISQRTAETHVEHILTKLGFTSRTQIAAWMSERAQESRAGEER